MWIHCICFKWSETFSLLSVAFAGRSGSISLEVFTSGDKGRRCEKPKDCSSLAKGEPQPKSRGGPPERACWRGSTEDLGGRSSCIGEGDSARFTLYISLTFTRGKNNKKLVKWNTPVVSDTTLVSHPEHTSVEAVDTSVMEKKSMRRRKYVL